MNKPATALFLAALAAGPAGAEPLSNGDLERLVEFFTGTFDSTAQYQMEVEAGLSEDERHPQTLLRHVPVKAPDLGAHVFYVEEAQGKPQRIVRKRVVSFGLDETKQTVRMKFFMLNDDGVSGAALAGLTADRVTPLTGCDIPLSYDGLFFEGAGSGKDCAVLDEPDKDKRYVQTTLTISPTQVMRIERMFYVQDDVLTDPRADAALPTVHFKAPD
jgi:hypothetical protein